MKKLLLTPLCVITISFFIIAPLFAYSKTEIKIKSVKTTTRSVVSEPEAFIQEEVLYVSFDAYGMYTLYIEDGLGGTVYTSILPADGMEYSYDLTGIGEGLFCLVIEGVSGEYEGYFTMQ